jgi:polygalacturonase
MTLFFGGVAVLYWLSSCFRFCTLTEWIIAVRQSKESCAHIVSDSDQRRSHSVSITDFGAVGDGKTLNTLAFQKAMIYLHNYADKDGARLRIPAGRWLTGSITLISHLTFFLENGAVILGSEVSNSI